MVDFKARRHRLELPSTPNSDDPAVLKRAMDQMKKLVQDEFNRLATDFYDFKKITYDAAIIPLRGVANIAITKDQYSMNATWENPDGDEITPTHVRVRILEISPNSWAEYTYPINSWEFNGLTPGTQYTFQVQLIARFEATDTFISTTRNCPSVPVLRTAESEIKAKVFTTDDGVGPPTDGGTNDTNITFTFPNTQGTPGAVDGDDCWWEYKFQYRASCAWVDSGAGGAEVDGDVGDVVIDTDDAPFTTYPNAIFRLAYREICDGAPEAWVYGSPFMAVDYSDPDCLGLPKSDSYSETVPVDYTTASLFALPSVCQDDGTNLKIVDALTDTEFFPQEPGFKCIEYIDGEWTIIGDSTDDPSISPTNNTLLLAGNLAAITTLGDESDFTIAFDVRLADDALYASGARGTYPLLKVGNKIAYTVTMTGATYIINLSVPRDGGGSYFFQTPALDVGSWYEIYYSHDTSEADGRKLYVDGILVAQSANAIANDFDGIDDTLMISTFNDMQIRKIYGWSELVVPFDFGSGLRIVAISSALSSGSTAAMPFIPGGVQPGDYAIVVRQQPSGSLGSPTVIGSGATPIVAMRNIPAHAVHLFDVTTGDTGFDFSGSSCVSYVVVIRGAHPTVPYTSFSSGSNSATGIDQTATVDGSLNVQVGTFGSSGLPNPSGDGFDVELNVDTAIPATLSGSVAARDVDVADGALGAGMSYAKTMVTTAIVFQPAP